MNVAALDRQWVRRALLVVAVLIVLAPAFGWAAAQVNYAEPLENAAEATGASDDAETVNPGLLPDYGVPGLPDPLGTLVSGVVGTALVLVIGLAAGRLLADRSEP